ncbi:MAG TPA: TIGR00180 family glycosyltransferase, partial [Methanocorpusculum sp.]|nr:TIGR00180 family glycosyltransferase [Methanocorpusculum sp.]
MDFIDEYYADKDLSLLKKLTLIIPTYNRNYYLSRCLWYHAHFPFGEIIVADSSPEEKKVVNRETVQKIREMFGANIQYLEYEPETEKYGGDIYRKWGDAVQHVETEYSQIVTDKEFLIPTTANKCIGYLEQHHDYSGSIGIRYDLQQEGWFNPWSPNPISFEEDTILERFKKYNSTEYPDELVLSIQRAEIHKVYYENLANYEIDD